MEHPHRVAPVGERVVAVNQRSLALLINTSQHQSIPPDPSMAIGPPYSVGIVGAFSHSAGNYYVVYPGNTPENHPPTEACKLNSNQLGVQNSGPWDPWQAAD